MFLITNIHFKDFLNFLKSCRQRVAPPEPIFYGLGLFLFYLVLSEIHSSLTSSFSLGSTLITSPPLVLTTMLLPTASNTSIDSVFLQRRKESDTKIKMLTNQTALNC